MVKISVIVTVYNVEKYIERCLLSVIGQGFKEFELIIVDDKTPDNSMEIVGRYSKKDSRIKIVTNEENCGLMWARKVGFENAMGKYVVFLDSDDTLEDGALETLFNAIEKSGSDILSGNIVYRRLDKTETVWKSELKYGTDPVAVYKSLLKNEYRHNLCSHIIKRSLLTDYNYKFYKNFTHGEDYCLFYQIVNNAKKIEHIDIPVYNYFQTTGSSTQVSLPERSIETTFVAYSLGYENLQKYSNYKKLAYSQNQHMIARLRYKNHVTKEQIYKMSKEYLPNDIISIRSILKCNTFIESIKLIAAIFF